MRKSKTIPTLIGLALTLLLTTGGALLINKTRTQPQVGATVKPFGVKTSNITDRSFSVSWFTQQPATGSLKIAEAGQILFDNRDQDPDQKHTAHFVTVTNLEPQKKYSFVIISGGENHQQSSFQVTTATAPSGQRPTADFAFGQVLTSDEKPAAETLIFLSLQGATRLATITNQDGYWSIALNSAFNKNRDQFVSYDRDSTSLELVAETAAHTSAQVTAHTGTDHPVPPIVLGRSYDYSQEAVISQQYPDANYPQTTPIIPSLSPTSPTPNSSTTTPSNLNSITTNIDTPKEGEVVFSSQPKFSGQGPQGQKVILQVESEQTYEEEVSVSEFGHWEWQAPEDLTAGEHTLTVRWQDESGAWQTIKRNFSVKAAETTSPSPTPITPLPTRITPTATAAVSPTAQPTTINTVMPTVTAPSPTTTITKKPSEVVSGNLTPLLILATLGVGMFIFALAIVK